MLNRNFFLLLQGMAVSSLGVNLLNIVYMLWLVKETGSGSVVGFFFLVIGIPLAVMSVFGGVIADRYSRRNLIVLSDSVCGLITLVLSCVFFLSTNTSILIVALFVSQFLICFVASFVGPAFSSLIPDLIPKKQLPMGNVLVNSVALVAQLLGRSLAGVLFALWSISSLVLITSICFLLSAFSEWFIKVQEHQRGKLSDLNNKNIENKKTILQSIKEGFLYILNDKGLKYTLIVKMGYQCCVGTLMIALPFLVEFQLHKGGEWFGYLTAVFMVGATIGSVYGSIKFNKNKGLISRMALLHFALCLLPLLFIAIGFESSVYRIILWIFVFGILVGIADNYILIQLQITTPSHFRARVMSVFILINSSTLLFGFISGIFIDMVDKNIGIVHSLTGVFAGFVIYSILVNGAWFDFMKYSEKNSVQY